MYIWESITECYNTAVSIDSIYVCKLMPTAIYNCAIYTVILYIYANILMLYNIMCMPDDIPVCIENSSRMWEQRRISILSSPDKGLARILSNRVSRLTEVLLLKKQTGFSSGRGYIDQNFVIRQLMGM